MPDKCLLFIPAYNCEKQISRVLKQLNKDIMLYISNVIVINNRSTDGTANVVCEFIDDNPDMPIVLLTNDDNYGLGGSHKVAFDYAIANNYDYIIVLHGDDQGAIEDMAYILKNSLHNKYDCCLGARFMKESKLIGYSKFRTFGNKVYNLLFSFVCKQRIFDLGSGLNIYSTEMLRSKFYFKFPDNLSFNYCMVLALNYYKQSALFFPISWRETDQVSNVKMLSQAIKVLIMLINYFFSGAKFINKDLREISREAYTAKARKQHQKGSHDV